MTCVMSLLTELFASDVNARDIVKADALLLGRTTREPLLPTPILANASVWSEHASQHAVRQAQVAMCVIQRNIYIHVTISFHKQFHHQAKSQRNNDIHERNERHDDRQHASRRGCRERPKFDARAHQRVQNVRVLCARRYQNPAWCAATKHKATTKLAS